MPMFYTPKPRQFHYNPRYYDPEKEKWEAIKKKYHYGEEKSEKAESEFDSDAELAYFENRLRQIDRQEKRSSEALGIKDLFRKRKMPEFHYTPRFKEDGSQVETPRLIQQPKTKVKIGHRFDVEDENYMKPMPAGKIMMYGLIAALLLYWILF